MLYVSLVGAIVMTARMSFMKVQCLHIKIAEPAMKRHFNAEFL